MHLDYTRKLSVGAALATVGGAGIILRTLIDWGRVGTPWNFIAGFVFGVMAGAGVGLVIKGLIDRRALMSRNPESHS